MSLDANKVTIKARYGEKITLKFQLFPSSGIAELQQQVAKRLKLESKTYSVKYKDEEDDKISIFCDEDLRDYMQTCRLQGSAPVVVLLEPRTEDGRHDGSAAGESDSGIANLCATGGQTSEEADGFASLPRDLHSPLKNSQYSDPPIVSSIGYSCVPKRVMATVNPDKGNEWSDKGKIIRRYFSIPHTEKEHDLILSWRSRPCNGEVVGSDVLLQLKDFELRPLALPVMRDYSQVDNLKDYFVSDSCIAGYWNLLKKRETENNGCYIPCGFISPFGSSKVYHHRKNGIAYNGVPDYVKKKELDGMEKVFIPICFDQHWYLLVADCVQKKLLWFDSAARTNVDLQNLFAEWMRHDVLHDVMEYNDAYEWPFVGEVENCPAQANLVDCGVYVMMIMDCLTCGEDIPFNDADMDNIRPKLFLDLLAGRIRHPCVKVLVV